MKITDLTQIELEQIDNLRRLSIQNGNVEAAKVLLEHLRETSKSIDQWRRNKTAGEKITASRKRNQPQESE